ncbi:MAG TPA: hypothetical protein VGK24_19745 [Candidatus Angelobacter sp.]|jgi:hypothetical protein
MDRMRNDYAPQDGFEFKQGENSLGMDEEEQALWEKARSLEDRYAIMQQRDARRLTEHNERMKERERQEWRRTEAGQLLKKLGECFAEYRDYVAKNPQLEQKALECDAINQKIFNKMKSTIQRANSAPRCRFEKPDGRECRAPRVRGKKYCHMHLMLEDARPEKIKLPSLGDANAIQAAIAKGAQAVVDGRLDQKQAGLLGYYLQLALSNVGRVDFEEGWEPTET